MRGPHEADIETGMDSTDSHYVHGTDPDEQARLSRLNALLNATSLEAMALAGGERVLDVGSGLGQLTRMIARRAGATGRVIAVERDADQRAEALRQARLEGEERLVDFRAGDAVKLPLADDEWGAFDVAHGRFLLEHVRDPLAVVRSMVRAVRPGGRIILEDDDHDVLRLSPPPPGVLELWRAYYRSYERRGKDPHVGRHLVSLLHRAGATPRNIRCLFFGGCAGTVNFDAMIDNFVSIMNGAREEMVSFDLMEESRIDAAIAEFRSWQRRPDAAMWYTTSWAEGVRPTGDRRVAGSRIARPAPRPAHHVDGSRKAKDVPSDEASFLRFLMGAAAELNSSLELKTVIHKIARGILPLIDYHLFCILLWNEKTQLLEHRFSMKYGELIPQEGGFPLGYGIGGTAALTRRPVRVANVLDDPRYVRYRHPEVEIHSELAVPLIFQDRLIGVLDLESTELDAYTEEHEQAVSALASHIATAIVNARLHEKVLHDEQRLERDLATARSIQRRLLPTSAPSVDGLDLGSVTVPARELGGDFYDFLRHADGRLAFAVGDVAGKATAAALLGSMAVGLLRGLVMEQAGGPAEMLAGLNEQLHGVGGDNRFVAMTYGVYDPRARRLGLANAGMPRAIVCRDGTAAEIALEGIPLGMFSGTSYRAETLRFDGGEVLVLCSDGLGECENARGETFGTPRLLAAVAELAPRSAPEIASGLARAVTAFAGDSTRQRDDYTVVVLKSIS